MKTYIIAEVGPNHNGSVDLAIEYIQKLSEIGIDAIKFQLAKPESLYSKDAVFADYQKKNTDASESQFDMIKRLELDERAHKELIAYCKKANIMFLSTPFDLDSVDLLNELGLQIFKIPSGEITNLPYLRRIGSLNKKVILSTGMSDLKEIGEAIKILTNAGTLKENITVLHANTMYPTPMEDVNLRAMQTIQNKFDVAVGYSDHTLGIEVDIAAVAMGATIIEKHFTIDKTMDGPDHKSSINPEELNAMVSSIRNIEKALGSSIKKPSKSEKPNIIMARKSIVASKSIKKGELFTEINLTTKRPGTGLSPMEWDSIIGKVAKRDYQIDDLL